MKLNVKRTCLVGLAFLSICAFWNLYDFVIPLVLKNTYHLGDTWSGVVMAMDNILALFLLPFFGALSDKANTRLGRRMPFILGGTAAAAALMLALTFVIRDGTLVLFLICLGLLLFWVGMPAYVASLILDIAFLSLFMAMTLYVIAYVRIILVHRNPKK